MSNPDKPKKYLKFRNAFGLKKEKAKRHPQIFNLQSSFFNSGFSGLVISFKE